MGGVTISTACIVCTPTDYIRAGVRTLAFVFNRIRARRVQYAGREYILVRPFNAMDLISVRTHSAFLAGDIVPCVCSLFSRVKSTDSYFTRDKCVTKNL